MLALEVACLSPFDLHGEAIIRLPGVRQTRTFFVLNEVVSTTALPV